MDATDTQASHAPYQAIFLRRGGPGGQSVLELSYPIYLGSYTTGLPSPPTPFDLMRARLPRRMGSTGWLMQAAARNAYYNRGSRANWEKIKKEREEVAAVVVPIIFGICGLIIAPFAVLLIAGMTLLYGPAVWVIPGLICLSAVYLLKVGPN